MTKENERSLETRQSGKKVFTLAIPKEVISPKETTPVIQKTSLYVESKHLFRPENGFSLSDNLPQVHISKEISNILSTVFKYGEVATRYGEGGLEYDIDKQQIIFYTAVTCQNHLLWYQRASSIPGQGQAVGDPRLEGKLSIGFGGHITKDDISDSRDNLVLLKHCLQAVTQEVGTVLGMNKGVFKEVEEELGLTKDNFSELKLLGAFCDKRVEDPRLDVQVGYVHTGIAAILNVNEAATKTLTFRKSEIQKAWWIPVEKINEELFRHQKAFRNGTGSAVESWTEVLIKEFLR